jgi:hypothetical protein
LDRLSRGLLRLRRRVAGSARHAALSAAAEPKTDPESDLFEALDAEAEASRE